MHLNADIVPIGHSKWRLIGQNGTCVTFDDPPAAWVERIDYACQGFSLSLDPELEAVLRKSRLETVAPPSGRVTVIGGGLMAAEAALGLALFGFTVVVSAPDAASTAIDPQSCYTDGSAAVRAWVLARLPSARVEATCHWTALTPGSSKLVLVATDTVQPDRAITDHLARQRLPYLVLRAHHDTGVLGPLVTHQTGPCLACLDLALADHDSLWPVTLAGLIPRQAQPSRAVAHWVGAQAALEAGWFLSGAGSTLTASTIEIDFTNAGIARRRWQPHRDCCCQLVLGQVIDLPLRRHPALDSQGLPLAA